MLIRWLHLIQNKLYYISAFLLLSQYLSYTEGPACVDIIVAYFYYKWRWVGGLLQKSGPLDLQASEETDRKPTTTTAAAAAAVDG